MDTVNDPKPPLRSWKEIARGLAGETNPQKILELSEDLNQALAEQKGPKAAE